MVKRRGVAAVAVVALLSSGMLATAYATPAAAAPQAARAEPVDGRPSDTRTALAQARSAGKRVEVTSERDATDTLWANADGTLTRDMRSTASRAQAADGSWKSIDTGLASTAGKLAPKTTNGDVSLSATGTGDLATLKPTDKTSFSLSLDGQVGAPTTDGPVAVYPVSSGATLRVGAADAGFSARLRLASAPKSAPTYTFPLGLKGLTPSLKNGVLTLADAGGSVVARSAPLSMWDSSRDAAGDRANQVPVDSTLVKTAGGGFSLVLEPSMAWLTAPTTKYPVTIDPDVNKVEMYGDTFISNKANAGNNYWDDYRIRVGSDDGSTKYRGIETFHTADFNGRDVKSAVLHMYQYFGASCSPVETTAWPTNGRQDTDAVTWTNRKQTTPGARWWTSKTFNNGNSTCAPAQPDAWVDLSVTDMTKGMTSGIIPNGSYQLQAAGDDDSGTDADGVSATGDKRFCSANPDSTDAGSSPCSVDTYKPYLSITYYPEMGVQSWYSLTDHPLNDRSTLKINNDGGNAVIQAKDVKLNGQGLDLSIDRFYNSQSTETTSMGTGGWSLSLGPDVYLESNTGAGSFDYVGPGGTRFGSFVRKTLSTTSTQYNSFDAPKYGGLDADMSDQTNDSNGIPTMTMTFHHSQMKYEFKKMDTGTDNRYLTMITDRSNNKIKFNYVSGTHQLQSITDSASRTVSFTYASGRVTQILSKTKAADGSTDITRTWKYGYTGSQLTQYTDPAGKSTTYSYATGLKVTDPANQSTFSPVTDISYYSGNAVSQVRYTRDVGDVVFAWQYFSTGGNSAPCPGTPDRWAKVTNLTAGDDSINKGPTYCFTERKGDANKKSDVVDALNNTKSSSYTADQQSDTATTAGNAGVTGGSTVSTYGTTVPDQLAKVTEPKDASDSTAGTTGFDYAANASVAGGKWLSTSKLDSAGKCTNYGYDDKGHTTDAYVGAAASTPSGCAGTNGDAGVDRFHKEYNDDGSIKWAYDGNGTADGATSATALDSKRTDFKYWAVGDANYVADTAGQLKSVVKPGGTCSASRRLCISYTYDGAGHIASITDGRGIITRYTVDNIDRVTKVQLNGTTTCATSDISAGNCVTYSYDAEGNLATRVDKLGTTNWSYDRMNRQLTESRTGAPTLTYTRDGTGNLKTLKQEISGVAADTVTYAYDPANRPKTISDATGTYSVTPDSDGRIASLAYPLSSGLVGAYSYTKSGKPKTVAFNKAGSSTPIVSYSLDYKNGSQQTGKLRKKTVTGSSTSLNGVFTYAYKSSGQLTDVDRDTASTDDFDYGYDKGGNLTSAKSTNGSTVTTTNYGYDRAGELCWSGTGSAPTSQLGTSCPTTPSGYTERTSDLAGNSLGTSANPIAYNANSQVTSIAGVSQGYNDLGNDLRVTTGSTTQVNSSLGVTAQKIGSTVIFYTRDSKGTLLNQHQSGGSGTHYYLADEQGSISAITGSTGTSEGTYFYDPYGKTTVNAVAGNTTLANNPWRYVGGWQDLAGAGSYHLGARYYDAAGHFTQPDAVQGIVRDPKSLNSYGYAGGDPVNNADPSGNTYLEGGVSACAFVCLNAALGSDDDGRYLTLGAAAGADIGVDAGVSAGTGTNHGGEASVGCSVATPIGGVGGEFSVSGGSVDGGGSLNAGLGGGCTAGLGYTLR